MRKKIISAIFVATLGTQIATNTLADDFDDELLNLSLETLMDIKIPDVTSVSRMKQSVMETAASVYVITQEDIKHNGITSIPEALKIVPGMQVFKLNSSTWSVSSRGFNYVFANKLLVLIDGKSVYSPLFSGVNWELQDCILEDIDRIEVIRGPGAVLWGANAVNGVINIITKSAENSQGNFASFSFDADNKTTLQYRYGGKTSDDFYYKLYAKSFERGAKATNNTLADNYNFDRVGMKIDFYADNDAKFNLQVDAYKGKTRPPLTIFNEKSLTMDIVTKHNRNIQGAYIIGSYKKNYKTGSHINVRSYLDYLDNDDYRINQEITTADVELQYDIAPFKNHHIIWGVGYRLANYKLDNMQNITVAKTSISQNIFSGYIQDSINITNKLNFIISSRIECYDLSFSEIQPNARFSYKLSEQATIWGSISRAVKVQSISEKFATSRDITVIDKARMQDIFDGTNKINLMTVSGNPNLNSEKLLSIEVGYKTFLRSNLSLVASVFFNRYNDLLAYVDTNKNPYDLAKRDFTLTGTTDKYPLYYRAKSGDSYITEIFTQLDNRLTADSHGIEIIIDWNPIDIWKLQFSYSYFEIKAKANLIKDVGDALYMTGNTDILNSLSAKHTANILSRVQLPYAWEFDTQVRYIDKLKNAGVDSRLAFDFRVGKQVSDNIQIDFIGKDVFYPAKYEFKDNFSGISSYTIGCSWLFNIRFYY